MPAVNRSNNSTSPQNTPKTNAARTSEPSPQLAEPRSWQPASSTPVASAADGFESAPPKPTPLPLSASVGRGGKNNRGDVLLVQRRLRELGYVVPESGTPCTKTLAALRLVEAIVNGKERTLEACGRVEQGSELAQVLSSPNAPRWQEIPAGGPGWRNVDADRHDYATDRTVRVLQEAGAAYQADFLDSHPGRSLIESNDASLLHGGDTRDHLSHETGLDLDVRLAIKNGAGGGVTVRSANYDREATRAIITAFAQNPDVERVLIGDARLVAEIRRSGASWASKVEDGGKVHENHVHVDIKPPSPQDESSSLVG